MWTRDAAGLTGIAVVVLYCSFYLLPATEFAGGALRQIAIEQRATVDQLHQAVQAGRKNAQSGAEAAPSDGAPIVRHGPNLLDGIVWGQPGGG